VGSKGDGIAKRISIQYMYQVLSKGIP